MSRGQRELQTGDLVEIPGQFGRYIITGAKSWKTLWVRPDRITLAGQARRITSASTSGRLAISRKKMCLVTPVEERVAGLLMGEG